MTVFDELNDPKACERHLARLRETFPDLGVRALLVRDTSNIQWLTAFDDVFDEEAAHALYVCPDHAWLHTDSRYVTACENAARHKPLEVSAERETHAQFAAKRWSDRGAGAVDALLGIEDGISLAECRRLQKAFAEADAEEPFVETDGVVVGLRAVKDRYEIARMRGAQSITDAAFEHIVRYMRPGMMERQVQLELEEFMLRHGAQGLAFPSIVATGPNGASPHAIPGATMLEAGQCVVLDFGARSYGYCSDMTRTVFLGEPDRRCGRRGTRCGRPTSPWKLCFGPASRAKRPMSEPRGCWRRPASAAAWGTGSVTAWASTSTRNRCSLRATSDLSLPATSSRWSPVSTCRASSACAWRTSAS